MHPKEDVPMAQAIFETAFDVVYLISVVAAG